MCVRLAAVECCPSCLAASIYFRTFSKQLGAHAGLICTLWVHSAQLIIRRLWGPARHQSRGCAFTSSADSSQLS